MISTCYNVFVQISYMDRFLSFGVHKNILERWFWFFDINTNYHNYSSLSFSLKEEKKN